MLASTGSSDTSRSTMMAAASEDSKSSSVQLLASSPERSGQSKQACVKGKAARRRPGSAATWPTCRAREGEARRPEAAQSQRSAVIYRKGLVTSGGYHCLPIDRGCVEVAI